MREELPSYWTLIRQTPEALAAKVAESPDQAALWVEAAAHSGSPSAIVNFGQMLLDGHGVPRDPERALRWFKIAAEADDTEAINMVGRCYENGWGTARDASMAVTYFERAAHAGSDWAQYNLGMLLVAGDGVPRDMRRALSLFVASARHGNAKAMNMLGRFCEEGWLGRVKLAAARRWYARAANGRCFRGQFHLARFLAADGKFDEAVDWLRKSLSQAPAEFRDDAIAILSRHDSAAIKSVAEEFRRR
ncbi:beta-lactamase HcpA precursor [Variibacter gotjawalensis]|uniref:Beta-lactamase HcpA n=1 Tax=Variibacter gotjawalensis TaxID=1333996 RepID=A0A0S3PZT6_9BRAD|nr:tetratricopeptide repeat protein [Variibacter gotjawalensis]NIK47264.1 hypothetical protein [Variibacter gotjawalensis]RZS49164.1 hypothetical protein EV661_1590 [Variibacter gotjawalensis]BAT61426.1 beta-lactamase HcpA precursor [Variibacter gotjawalensis]